MLLDAVRRYLSALPARFRPRRLVFSTLLIAMAVSLAASRTPTALEQVIESGTLKVLSRNGPTTYYEGPHGKTGFEYTLLRGFADYLGVELELIDEASLATIIQRIDDEQAHLAAAGLSITAQRARKVAFTQPYLEVTQQLIYRRGQDKPADITELNGDLLVIADSSHVERLQELQRDYPALSWREQDSLEMIDLLEMVHRGEIDYAIVDSNAYAINAQTFPRAQVAFELGDTDQLGWAFPKRADRSLLDKAQAFLQEAEENGALEQLAHEFFDTSDRVSTGGALLFTQRLEDRLPQWQETMQKVAEETDLSWQLLAAMSYQESHWNPRARSHTGVRGLMMLTRTTARELGIKNRLDPEQSIRGGARYFKSLYNRIPDRIAEPDRTLLALAAYNVGMGHLEDARRLTEHLGDNPDLWEDVQQHLPKLAKRKYYSGLKYGYARGWEPVQYANNIFKYRDIIAWHAQQEQRRLAMANGGENLEAAELPDETEDSPLMPMSIL
ncbi:membrane-bound lytic murein transglycosylase MltF [Gilvimarinus sp. SDUM040013]|uniref:Membrane-bound lytic murein transglycosylase F n=1 Tax=Gilvimarinus gilvus TaxID=3058038 RepID=A0ABU4RXW8_9GAMM|nr:membrane-bound lytic murein transglycosylase MltF [Gilvimarinus sp. SDUM040013]MDO3388259.1 membrane-bound lytic murein transglycosylase MltF [Gilvimarinus sp. SDUM040013]MDX6847809.1 membrane-bound lytic murein transglycosylase MltF [Gilvimarinus sp. SDUM040013]